MFSFFMYYAADAMEAIPFMGFRVIWYQNFSYFRIMTVMLVVYVLALFAFRWFVACGNKSRSLNKLGDGLPGVNI